jgi:hypothetical protein
VPSFESLKKNTTESKESDKNVGSDKSLGSFPDVENSEESVSSEKVTTPIEIVDKSSEESVSSEKVTTPIIENADKSSEKSLKPIENVDKSIEKSVSSEKVITPIENVDKSSEKSVESIPSKKTSIDLEENEEDIRNIDGMKLNKPYYFQTLIEKKDPILILKEDTKEYNAYSRTCLSDKRRQPVILTDSQIDKINKDHPGFLREQDVLKYGSDEKHQYNYICPRYWCIKNNTFIDPKDIKEVKGKDGKIEYVHEPKKGPSCGKVLPKKDKKIKPGYYIYEFNDESYPGLIPDKHPNGLCLPCCFKNYNTDGRIKAKQRCLENDKKEDNKEVKKKEEVSKSDEYILGPEKFPLDIGRWGYLPPEIQTILHEINADCQISKTNTNIKENHPCLLRHGIEINKKQSFVAAISDEIFFGKRIIDQENKLTTKVAKVLTVKEMR